MHMNEIPAYRTQWGAPQHRYKTPSKVVSIPVHFVGSECSRSDSAIKIQKVARGFLVRRSVKTMAAIKVELVEIERKVSASETVELIKKNQRERVRVSETIMNLLLKLDSVRVLNYSALRDCRKSLIKKAIALQELVDQIEMMGPAHQDQEQSQEASSASSETNECVKIESLGGNKEENCLVKEEEEMVEGVKMESLGYEEGNSLVKEEEDLGEKHEEEGPKMGTLRDEEEGAKMETLGNEEDMVGEESVGTSLVDENCVVKEEECGKEEEGCKGDENRVLLEKMIEDNEKMMGMMNQLFQRNEMQTKLLSSLSRRVEQLEKAFACEKLRKKKRRNADDVKHKDTNPKNGCV